MQTLFAHIARELAPVLQNARKPARDQITRLIIENDVITNINIFNREKQLVFHQGATTIGEPSFSPFRPQNVDFQTPHLSYPIMGTEHKQPIGWIYAEINTNFFDVLQYQTHALVLLVVLFAFLVALALSTIFSRRLLVPVKTLTQAIETIGSGVYDHKTSIPGHNEFSQLANSLNLMANRIASTQQELQNHIDQSIEDMHETLETIEIQNVELDIARKQALEASRIKSEFLANTSHEIRTPLNGIIGFTNLMFKTELDNQQLEYLRTIENSSQNLLAIINDILDFSRIESGKLSLSKVAFNVRQLVEETLQILATMANEKSLNLIYFMDPKTPAEVIGDPLRLRQILTNLINNAIKFSHSGNILIHIAPENNNETRTEIKFSVTDYGVGIHPEKANHLFQAFSQIDDPNSRKQSGSGLGLAISKGLVEKMEGNIGLETEYEKGSRFWFTVWLENNPQPTHSSYNELSNRHLVIIEENKDAYLQLKQMARCWNAKTFRIPQFAKLEKTLKKILSKTQPLPLLIYSTSSSHLHQQEANTTLTKLQNARILCQCPIICLSHPNEQRRLQALGNTEGLYFLNKPVLHDRLYRMICSQLKIESQLSYQPDPQIPQSRVVVTQQLSVLAVDDNRANLLLVSEFLNNLGANVTTAKSGEEAIEATRKEQFDLIFMDVQMPEIDGLEATQKIRAQEPQGKRTPIVALTAHALDEQKGSLLLAGMDDLLSKPISQEQLAIVIGRWCKDFTPNTATEIQNTPIFENPSVKGIPSQRGPVDLAECLKLSNYKQDLASDMLAMLLDAIPQEIDSIATSYESKDYLALAEKIHKLHGGCCYVGVPTLKGIAALLDNALEKKQWHMVENNIGTLFEALNELNEWGNEHDLEALFER